MAVKPSRPLIGVPELSRFSGGRDSVRNTLSFFRSPCLFSQDYRQLLRDGGVTVCASQNFDGVAVRGRRSQRRAE